MGILLFGLDFFVYFIIFFIGRCAKKVGMEFEVVGVCDTKSYFFSLSF